MVLLALCASAFAACRSGNDDVPVRVIDLLREVDRAEKRPSGGTFEISEHTLGSVGATSLSVPAPSRIIWTLRFPRRATFRAQVAAPALPPGGIVTFRVGVSDDRIYERLAQAAVTGAAAAEWTALTADLSAYAGWKWSLFYRPETHPWRLVLSADTNGVTARALWASPGIDTDRARARDFARRKQE